MDQGLISRTVPISPASPVVTREPTRTKAPAQNTNTPLPPPPSPSPTITQTPLPAGPDVFPENINPLSGLPVQDPDLLDLPPALVSISNAPLPTRPQAGLSFSPLVFEMYIGEGVSRYLAVFYGEFPQLIPGSPGDVIYGMEEAAVGPIRSGRLPYAKLRQIYNGFLVFASASSRVLPYLEEYYIFYREDLNDYNLALLPVGKLIGMAEEMLPNHSKRALFGNKFDSSVPTEGKDAKVLWVPFHELDQIVWKFDAESGAYHRYQDREDGKTFKLMTDRLTGEALAFENIIILLADYTFYDATLFNIELMYLDRYPALLFRDGKMQEIYWSTANEAYEASTGFIRPIRFRDKDGQPVPLKHGQTWVEIIPRNSPYYEVAANPDYAQFTTNPEPGSAHWLVYFQQPPFPKNVEPEDLDE